MAYITIPNVQIVGFSACVPSTIVENIDSELFSEKKELLSYISTTGVERRHVADKNTCSSDLCYHSAEKLIAELGWEKSEIDCIIFVSQTPDYIYPATACLLQNRLGLSDNCVAFDLSMSCPGWIFGLSTIAALVSSGGIKKALLLVGETVSKTRSPFDKLNIISGDAGTATALIYNEGCANMYFNLRTNGEEHTAVLIPDGGYRNPYNEESLKFHVCEDGIRRTNVNTLMDGASIFSFAITYAPRCIKELIAQFNLDSDSIDYFLLHQANLKINQMIQKKLKIDNDKVINNLTDYGNTSSSAIPLGIVCQLGEIIANTKIVACAFGGGLAWGSVYFETKNIVCSKLITI